MATFQPLSFVPTSVSGCTLWLDGADPSNMTFSGSNVTTWRDKSGNSNNAVTGTSAPSWNSLDNTVNFNGVNQNLLFTNPAALVVNKAFFFFLVEKRVAASPYILSGSSAGTNLNLLFNYDNPNTRVNFEFYGSGFTSILSFPAYSASTEPIRLWTGAYTGSSRSLLLNGGASSVTGAFTQNLTSWSNGGMGRVYAGQVNDAYSALKIYEVLFYNNLSSSQQQQVEGYLAWKWGLQASLPTTHPYSIMAPNSQGLPVPSILTAPLSRQSLSTSSAPIVYFNPTYIPGCQLWFDAADVATLALSGSTVTSWRDKSGTGRNATAVGTPTYSNNGVVFTRSPYFTTTYSAVPTAETIFVVTTFTGSVNFINYAIIGSTASNGRALIAYRDNSSAASAIYTGTVGVGFGSGTGISFNTRFIAKCVYSGGSGATGINGDALSTSAVFNYSGAGLTTIGFNSLQYEGIMNEIVIYNTALSTAQRQQVEGYLAWKWGLQSNLPSNHPYRNSVPGLTINIPVLPSQAQSGSFNPKNYSGMALWLDASDASTVVLSGSTVTGWIDKSGNGRNGTPTGTPTVSTAVFNNRQSINFNGSSYFLGSISITGTTVTNFAVVQLTILPSAASADMRVLSLATPSNYDYDSIGRLVAINGQRTGYANTFTTYRNIGFATATSVVSATTPYIVHTQFNGSVPTTYLNGTQGTTVVSSSGTFAISSYGIGNQAFPTTEFLRGNIGEVIVYNTSLTDAQRQSVEGYLAWKWGLQGSLPSNHPFAKFPPPPN